jgi:polyhydroxybutyrate depolymerase
MAEVMLRLTVLFLFSLCATVGSAQEWPDQTPPNEVPVYLPPDYDPAEPAPLLIFLHGWAPITTVWYDVLIPLQQVTNDHGYIFAKPDGSPDPLGNYFWNATDACCDMWGSDPDHVGYLLALVESIQETYNVDPQSIHLIGHSNGGFMAHRMACEAPGTFASVVSLAGAMWNDPSDCQPSEPIHVLEIHGTLDPVIWWLGGYLGVNPYPSASTTAAHWAAHNGCSTEATNAGNLNFDLLIPFAETTRWTYGECDDSAAGSSELWQVTAGGHFFTHTSGGISALFNYFDTHRNSVVECEADVDSDQQVNVSDLLFVINEWGSSGSTADINGDGTVNIQDLLMVINSWGPCA